MSGRVYLLAIIADLTLALAGCGKDNKEVVSVPVGGDDPADGEGIAGTAVKLATIINLIRH